MFVHAHKKNVYIDISLSSVISFAYRRKKNHIELINENKIHLNRFYSAHNIHHIHANVFPFMHLPDRIVCPEAIYSGSMRNTFAWMWCVTLYKYIHEHIKTPQSTGTHHTWFVHAGEITVVCCCCCSILFFLLFFFLFVRRLRLFLFLSSTTLCNNFAWLHASDERTRARSNSLFHNYVCRICCERTHTACFIIIVIESTTKKRKKKFNKVQARHLIHLSLPLSPVHPTSKSK